MTYAQSNVTKTRPGTIPEIKSFPIETSVMEAYNSIGIEGGIKIPNVPDAAIRPYVNFLS